MLSQLTLKRVYSSSADDLISDFYVPVLSEAISYKRIAGYFSGTSLLLAARGIAQLIENGGTYRLITGVEISEQDYAAILEGSKKGDERVVELFDFERLSERIGKDYLQALAYLISTGKLQIKFALVTSGSGIFHEKIGIVTDSSGDMVSFSGSVNETAAAWKGNIEEFKVFKSWNEAEAQYLASDNKKFDSYWAKPQPRMLIVDVPEAIKNNFIKIKPLSSDLERIVANINSTEQLFASNRKELYPYQKNAVKAWESNDRQGILVMATGSGKTITSLGAARLLSEELECLAIIIAAPQKHLVRQWLKDVPEQLPGTRIIEAHSDMKDWLQKASGAFADYQDGFENKVVIVTTYASLASDKFTDLLNSQSKPLMLIADEMHNLGAPQLSRAMLPIIKYRLGLSATPTRAWDEEGTQKLKQYFSKVVYTYDISQAIADGRLTPYNYTPIPARLNVDEFEKYALLSRKISRSSFGRSELNDNQYMKTLLLLRSKIIKKSTEKIVHFEALISRLNKADRISHLLVYCDSTDQLEEAQKVLNKYSIVSHRFTENENIKEREQILKDFSLGRFQALVAIKCLDEGVDIPSTKQAIILASSSNPREYIQRRGRVLRKYPGKTKANIYDFIVLPPANLDDEETLKLEKKLLANEFLRVRDFLETALNKVEIIDKLYDIMLEYNIYL